MWWDKRQEYYDDPYGGNEDLHNDGCLSMFIWLVVSGLVCFFMGSCKTKYVSVPEYHTEYVYKTDSFMLRDSIYERDSVYIVKSGDTITTYKTKILYRDRWRNVVKVDSFIKTDSIRVPVPVVTNKVRWQDKAAYIGLGIVISLVIIIVVIMVRWLRARSLV